MTGFLLSPSAKKRLQVLCQGTTPPQRFRVTVLSGGCKGFQYHFALDSHKNSDDHVFDFEGVEVILDETSLSFLQGSTLDFAEEMMGHYFFITNPDAKGSCGCGNSFSV